MAVDAPKSFAGLAEVYEKRYAAGAAQVDTWLAEALSARANSPLYSPTSYSVLAPGKRIRPILALASADLAGIAPEQVRCLCVALEFLHAASLIHDDLPSLDDDDLRRGVPTCHKKFGEAAALLAGDVLVGWAYEAILNDSKASPESRLSIAHALTHAWAELCEGQMLDVSETEIVNTEEQHSADVEERLRIRHHKKTGALFGAALTAPLYLTVVQREALLAPIREFATQFGLLFQITDDLIDYTAKANASGKTAGSDSRRHLVTYVSLYGVAQAEQLASEAADRARAALKPLGERAWFLELTCQKLLGRNR